MWLYLPVHAQNKPPSGKAAARSYYQVDGQAIPVPSIIERQKEASYWILREATEESYGLTDTTIAVLLHFERHA